METTKLYNAISQNDVEEFKRLFSSMDNDGKDTALNKWVNPNDEIPLIIHASQHNCIDIVKVLVTFDKININAQCPKDGTNALYHACRRNYTEMVRLLMENGGVSMFFIFFLAVATPVFFFCLFCVVFIFSLDDLEWNSRS